MAGTKGRSGGIPIPTALMKKRGTKRAKYDRHDDEPKPKLGIPRCPRRWLDAEARAEWNRIAPVLTQMGVLAEHEHAALTGYCESWSTYLRAMALVQDKKVGLIMKRQDGTYAVNPAVKIKNDEKLAMLRFAQDLGLTPASRTRVHAKPVEEPEFGVAKFLGAAG